MNLNSVGFIGGGRITRLMLEGWRRAGQLPASVVVSDNNAEVLTQLQASFPGITGVLNDNRAPAARPVVFIALHPPAIAPLLEEIHSRLQPDAVVISLAPKLSISRLSAGLGGFSRIVRMIPNAPSIVNAGYNPVVYGEGITAEEKTELQTWFAALGTAPEVAENKLEAYAVLTAMGPTYFWFQWHEMQSLAEAFGLTTEEAQEGIAAMLSGALATMNRSGLTPAEVMDLVPVHPIGEDEDSIRAIYHNRLEGIYRRLTG